MKQPFSLLYTKTTQFKISIKIINSILILYEICKLANSFVFNLSIFPLLCEPIVVKHSKFVQL